MLGGMRQAALARIRRMAQFVTLCELALRTLEQSDDINPGFVVVPRSDLLRFLTESFTQGSLEAVEIHAASLWPHYQLVTSFRNPRVEKQMTTAIKPRCGARTRMGRPCRAPACANGRCRMHGGLSTGCRTAEGRAKVTAAAKSYWARWRAERAQEVAPS